MPVVISFHAAAHFVVPCSIRLALRKATRLARARTGTSIPRGRWPSMTDPELRAQSFDIAWKYLDRSGLLTGEHEDSARFILNRIDRLMLRGERRRLLLSNAAIDAYLLRPTLVPMDT
ncbi:hypothetical protein [Bradyrhizobium ottawaense]|uniref:Uncharacterized protein n=2 Tax=Bradyrhizobium ottawaense TaxID=931866 RepID=A0ABV4G4L4_9BRAD